MFYFKKRVDKQKIALRSHRKEAKMTPLSLFYFNWGLMMKTANVVIMALVISLGGLCFASSVSAQFVSGTSTAEVSTDPGFEGLWKYCIDAEWDVTAGQVALSHFTADLQLDGCSCICDPGFFVFASPAGSGVPGSPDPCTVLYDAAFNCDGDPTIPEVAGPSLKFEYIETGCEPQAVGTLTVCFYSPVGPNTPQTYTNALVVKAGIDSKTFGDLVGVLPLCDCAVSVDHSHWGEVKSLFR